MPDRVQALSARPPSTPIRMDDRTMYATLATVIA